jgi:hypothetical protein
MTPHPEVAGPQFRLWEGGTISPAKRASCLDGYRLGLATAVDFNVDVLVANGLGRKRLVDADSGPSSVSRANRNLATSRFAPVSLPVCRSTAKIGTAGENPVRSSLDAKIAPGLSVTYA